MQKRSIEDYIREMERMRAKAIPLPEEEKKEETVPPKEAEPIPDEPDDAEAVLDEIIEDIDESGGKEVGMGRLSVSVTTGAGLFPVENATVVISEGDGSGGEIAAVKTDDSGKTPTIYLPAPDKEMSQQPMSEDADNTRAQYNITVSAPGYVTVVVEGISVFDDVTAIQKIDMLTVSAADGDTSPRIIDEKTIYRL